MLVRVLEIPASTGNFHFGGGKLQTFIEVDWFRDENASEPDTPGMMETESGRNQIAEFIREKQYFNPNRAYLVLHPNHSFTINYSAP